jgi:prolipoprotein diacylglyceryl transferase
VPIRAYALCILVGILVAWFVIRRRWQARGGDTEKLENLLLGTIVAGILGARLYFVLIEWPRYFGSHGTWYHIFYVWEGGLGIWGGVTIGTLTAFLLARHYHFRFLVVADCIAPALPLAQAIGRLGNWWNQELYGRPTTLPWGLEIDLAHRVAGYQGYATFHPTFLYEMVWDLAVVAFLLFVLERRWHFGRGKLFASYVVCYAVGRFIIESFRIDPVHSLGGLRVNSWVTLVGGLAGLAWLIWLFRHRPGADGPDSAVAIIPVIGRHTVGAVDCLVEEDPPQDESDGVSATAPASPGEPDEPVESDETAPTSPPSPGEPGEPDEADEGPPATG